MPIPTPKPNEKQHEFISRCYEAIKDEYTRPQSFAICYNKYREYKKK